jgi:hypothetical protein
MAILENTAKESYKQQFLQDIFVEAKDRTTGPFI